MIKMRSPELKIGLLTACIFSFAGCSLTFQNAIPPRASRGVLDLSKWDFAKDGPIELSGEYEFYWQQLLSPEDFARTPPPRNRDFIQVPSCWKGHDWQGAKLPGEGYATYRLTILLKDSLAAQLALKFLDMGTAFTVFANGEKTLSVGIVGPTPETSKPSFLPQVVDFGGDSNRVELIYQVSNFHYLRGGAWEVIRLGTEQQLNRLRERRLTLDLILFGSILTMGLYHLTLFTLRKNDLSSLFFGSYCLLIAVRLLTTVEKFLLQTFPQMNWELFVKVEYLTICIGVPIFALFLYKLFAQDFHKSVVVAIVIAGFLFAGVVCLTPARVFTQLLVPLQGYMLVSVVYGLSMLARFAARKQKAAAIILVGFLFLSATIVNDILDANGIIQTGHFVHLGFFVFIFSHAFILSARYSSAFQTIAWQRHDLENANEALQVEIAEHKRTKDILEQLVATRTEQLRNSEEIYRMLYNNTPVMMHSIDREGKIVNVNDYWLKILRYEREEVIGKPSVNFLTAASRLYATQIAIPAFFRTGLSENIEYQFVKKSGEQIDVVLNAIAVRDEHGEIERSLAFIVDVTDQKRDARTLLENEAKFRTLTETITAGIFIFQGTKMRHVNSAAERISGYPRQELLAMNFWDVIHPEWQALVKERGLARQRGEPVPNRYETQILTKTGEARWIDFTASQIEFEGKPAILGTALDITSHKQAEQAIRELNERLEQRVIERTAALRNSNEKLLQEIHERERAELELKHSQEELRNLSAHQERLREEERAHIAREIHDELGQVLSILNMDLATLKNQLPKGYQNLFDLTKSMSELISLTLRRVKRISQELRPSVLDHLSFPQSVTWQVEEFMAKTGISCSLAFENAEDLRLSREASGALFRVLQEALTNVLRHAEATSVKVGFKKTDDQVTLKIEDNGKGMTPAEKVDTKSFGLIGMRERIRRLEGTITITSSKNQGTTIVCEIPASA